jgi:hypothetical protein
MPPSTHCLRSPTPARSGWACHLLFVSDMPTYAQKNGALRALLTIFFSTKTKMRNEPIFRLLAWLITQPLGRKWAGCPVPARPGAAQSPTAIPNSPPRPPAALWAHPPASLCACATATPCAPDARLFALWSSIGSPLRNTRVTCVSVHYWVLAFSLRVCAPLDSWSAFGAQPASTFLLSCETEPREGVEKN